MWIKKYGHIKCYLENEQIVLSRDKRWKLEQSQFSFGSLHL